MIEIPTIPPRIPMDLLNSADPRDQFAAALIVAYELGLENVFERFSHIHTREPHETDIAFITRVAQYDFILGASKLAIYQDYYDKLMGDSKNQSRLSSNSDIL